MSKLIEIAYGNDISLEAERQIDQQFKGCIYENLELEVWVGEWASGSWQGKYHLHYHKTKEVSIDYCRRNYHQIPKEIRDNLATISWDYLTYAEEVKSRLVIPDDKLPAGVALSSKFIWRLLNAHKDKPIKDKEEIFHNDYLMFLPKPTHIDLLQQVYEFYSGKYGGVYTPEATEQITQAIYAVFENGSLMVIE